MKDNTLLACSTSCWSEIPFSNLIRFFSLERLKEFENSHKALLMTVCSVGAVQQAIDI